MSARNPTILALALAAGLSTSGHATTILTSTLNGTGDTNLSVNGNSAAESFVADSTSISDLMLELSATSPNDLGSIVITIKKDTTNKVGSLVDTIQTVYDNQLTATEQLYDFSNLSVNNLIVGNAYYVVVSKNGTTVTSANVWTTIHLTSGSATASTLTTGSTGLAAPDTDFASGSISGGTSKFMTMCVSDGFACDTTNTSFATISQPAPEPASVAILGFGLTGIGFIRRRWNNRAKV